ncbi:hypothetical protein SDC9_20870 [bioreactor metagenome]|uniref:Uncharacterized protein n=1 Tax=bioreactor metagenome TaxID=1076179 RepID=A0A644U7Y9_9ZZZZ
MTASPDCQPFSVEAESAEKETADKMESFLKQASDKAKEQQKKQAK